MPDRSALLAEFAARYIWWRDEHPPSDDRIVAQVMNLGTYDDIRRLEAALSPDELRRNAARCSRLDQQPLLGFLARAPSARRRGADSGDGASEGVSCRGPLRLTSKSCRPRSGRSGRNWRRLPRSRLYFTAGPPWRFMSATAYRWTSISSVASRWTRRRAAGQDGAAHRAPVPGRCGGPSG